MPQIIRVIMVQSIVLQEGGNDDSRESVAESASLTTEEDVNVCLSKLGNADEALIQSRSVEDRGG